MADSLSKDKIVALAYQIFVDGDLMEEVDESDPLEYLHGHENVVPGLETALEGMSAGDEFDVTVAAEDAYGDYDEDLIEAVPLAEFDDADGEIEIGTEIDMIDEDDNFYVAIVVGFEDDDVLLDMNHPLAGKDVRYAGKIVSVRDASEEELEDGMPQSWIEEYFSDVDWMDDIDED